MALASTSGTLGAVAKLAGVSVMTVSRVLRNHPRVATETRLRVMNAAKQIGYRPDPHIARLMARVRSYQRRRAEAVIALIRDDTTGDVLLDSAYHYVSLQDINDRASLHGYRAEEFRLNRQTMSVDRLHVILETRGIEGLIISPQSSNSVGVDLDYARFAAVTLGYGLQQPPLHRASTNMNRGLLQTTTELSGRGYRRIGLAVTQWIDSRSEYTYSGAMLNYQRHIPPRDRVPMLLFQENNIANDENLFCSWFTKHRPDVLITFDTYVPDWLTKRLNLRIPDQVGLVVHDWLPWHTNFSGINHRRPQVAAAAVDLLATMLMHNERDVPMVPRQVLIPPAWVDGPSVRRHQ